MAFSTLFLFFTFSIASTSALVKTAGWFHRLARRSFSSGKESYCLFKMCIRDRLEGESGAETFTDLLKSYFRIGGVQHQPNVVNVSDLRAAQKTPEKYKDLIIRMWGVSAHFVNLPLDVQEEFISRYEGL